MDLSSLNSISFAVSIETRICREIRSAMITLFIIFRRACHIDDLDLAR